MKLQNQLKKHHHAFTLIELLVVVVILAILAGLSFPIYNKVTKRAYMAKEMSAGRSLVAAAIAHAADNGGELVRGHDGSHPPMKITTGPYAGITVSGAEVERYPFRLGLYFDHNFDGTTVVNNRLKQLMSDQGSSYLASLLPAFGINGRNVGGMFDAGSTPSSDCVTNIQQIHAPSQLIAFVTARIEHEEFGGMAPGFHMVDPPMSTAGGWSGSYSDTNASSWGNVDLRYGNKALAAFMDGSVRLLGEHEIEDLRLWNNEAAKANDPNYRPGSANPSTGGGRGGRDRGGRR
ncbi:MAG: prepilin-type N-terminal cleavage/methylation domain-containing protein [Verrucomicrobiota bacterium]